MKKKTYLRLDKLHERTMRKHPASFSLTDNKRTPGILNV